MFDNVKLIHTNSVSEMFEQILDIGKNDVIIAISFPRYSKRIINAVEYAGSKRADVVALTDSVQSPIAEYADHLLIAQSDMASFVDSLVAPLSIINAMIVAVSRRKQEELTKAFYAVSEKLYQQANPQGAQGCDPNCGGNCGNDGVVDADYETVD